MKKRIVLLLAIVTAWAIVGLAQQPTVGTAKTKPAAKALAPAQAAASTAKTTNAIDPDEAYKANCSRCHVSPRKFPEGKMATIMRRMRVRANLTEAEAEAILRYLTK